MKFSILKKKEFFRKGSEDILGFLTIAPVLILFLVIIVSSIQIGVTNQILTNAVYNCGRAAAVSETQAIGQQRAEQLYEACVGDLVNSHGYVACEIEVLDGETWRKGAYIRCTVRTYVDVLMPFTSGVREQSIVMMIEGGDI